MFLTEYDQEKVLSQERRETERMTHEQVATDMLMGGEPLEKYSEVQSASGGRDTEIGQKSWNEYSVRS